MVKVGAAHELLAIVLGSDGRSHAKPTADVETLDKVPTLPAEGVAFLCRGTEGCRTHSVPKKGTIQTFSVGQWENVNMEAF